MGYRYRASTASKISWVLNYVVLGLVNAYPFWFMLQASLAGTLEKVSLVWPRKLYYANYYILAT